MKVEVSKTNIIKECNFNLYIHCDSQEELSALRNMAINININARRHYHPDEIGAEVEEKVSKAILDQTDKFYK
jgi:hypothetical protein